MERHTRVSAAERRRLIFVALAWLGAWWTLTLSLGWVIMRGSLAPLRLEPISSLAARLF